MARPRLPGQKIPCKTSMGKSQEKRNRKGRIQLLLSPVGEFSKTCLLFVCLFWYVYHEIVMYNYML